MRPVFYDCEASSLDGYIIEVGWAFLEPETGRIVTAAHLVRPAPAWKIKDAWSKKSEKLHGISLAELWEHGKPAHEVARIMNTELNGCEIFSDSSYDEAWLGQMFEVAGIEPTFEIRRTLAPVLLEEVAADRNFDLARLQQARKEAEGNRRHRALDDALIWAQLWQMVVSE